MEKPDKDHRCQCRSTQRWAAILLGGCESGPADFGRAIAGLADDYFPEMSVAVFAIGKGSPFPSAPALRNFVETHWAPVAGELRACWIDPDLPLNAQFAALGSAVPLREWTGAQASPLADILNEGRIETWFQPVFKGQGLELWGYECLARARDADGKPVSAAELFRWAREDNLTFMLDRICRETHIRNAATVNHSKELTFLVNFLPAVIYDPAVCLSTTFAAAKSSGLEPGQIIFEVVETEKVDDREFLSRILEEYRRAGFGIALDDIGTGHAGLALLGDISPDLIKIDRELVEKSSSSKLHRRICRSIVELAHDTGKLALAEGVETEEEYALFRRMGIDLFQGYLFGRPSEIPSRAADVESITVVLEKGEHAVVAGR